MKLDLEELKQYPDILNKEQFRTVCHISKRTALYLLQSGLVKAIYTGKKTHSWLIRKKDVIAYAEAYNKNSFVFLAPEKWYIYKEKEIEQPDFSSVPHGQEFDIATKQYYTNLLEHEKDILNTCDIIRLTGYSGSSVGRWIRKGHLNKHFAYVNKYYIPKIYFFSFLCGEFYNNLPRKTSEHLKSIHDICNMVYCGKLELSEKVIGKKVK